ncbi:hypothetical protein AeRB84_015582 [Aphanomyces euteiches]|nr:hypothetical protein AeRB84_015582 [Aphanomyces euteiches]
MEMAHSVLCLDSAIGGDNLDSMSSSNNEDGKYNRVAWGSTNRALWWPVYLCDPATIRDELHILQKSHKNAYKSRHDPSYPIVYCLGRYIFEDKKMHIKPWHCLEHDSFVEKGLNSASDKTEREWARALREAQRIRVRGVVPYLLPPDLNKKLPAPPKSCNAPPGSIVWLYQQKNRPWVPCYIFDPMRLRHLKGNVHSSDHLATAQRNPEKYYFVYAFGEHTVSLYLKSTPAVKYWGCPEHDGLIEGLPKIPGYKSKLDKAVQEVVAFAALGHDWRMLTLPGYGFVEPNVALGLPLVSRATPVASSQTSDQSITQTPAKEKKEKKESKKRPISPPPAVEKLSKQQKKELRERLYLEKEAATQALIMTNPDYPNGVAWANRVSTMWTPVYICDLAKWLIPQGKRLEPIQVYFFGTHEIAWYTGQLKPWKCPNRLELVNSRKSFVGDEFDNSLLEAEDFYNQLERIKGYLSLHGEVQRLNKDEF